MTLKRRLDALEAAAAADQPPAFYWPVVLIDVAQGTPEAEVDALLAAQRERIAAAAGRDLCPPPPGTPGIFNFIVTRPPPWEV